MSELYLEEHSDPLPPSLPPSDKDTESGEVLDAAALEVWILLAVEVEVEPVSELYLEEHSDPLPPPPPPSLPPSYKDTEGGEVLDAAALEVWILLAVEVEVEPVSELYLEEHSDQVVSFSLGDVDDETTGIK